MILVVCIPCNFVIRIMPTHAANAMGEREVNQLLGPDSNLWPNGFECVKCGKNATGMLERAADPKVLRTMELRDLTPHEAFAAFNGLGPVSYTHLDVYKRQSLS